MSADRLQQIHDDVWGLEQACSAFNWPLRLEIKLFKGGSWQNHRGFREEELELAKAMRDDFQSKAPGFAYRLVRLSYEVID